MNKRLAGGGMACRVPRALGGRREETAGKGERRGQFKC